MCRATAADFLNDDDPTSAGMIEAGPFVPHAVRLNGIVSAQRDLRCAKVDNITARFDPDGTLSGAERHPLTNTESAVIKRDAAYRLAF